MNKKSLIFFIFILFITNSYIINSKSFESVSFIEKTQVDTFDFDISGVNNSMKYANRIGQINFEFAEGTMLNELYPNKWQNGLIDVEVVEFTDIEFFYSNTTYLSKMARATRVSSYLYFIYKQTFNTPIQLKRIITREIVRPNDASFLYFYWHNTAGTEYFYYRLDFLTGNLHFRSQEHSLTLLDATFIPTSGYDFVYFEFQQSNVYVDFKHLVEARTFKDDGSLVSYKSNINSLVESLQENEYTNFQAQHSLPNINDYCEVVAIDVNYQLSYSETVIDTIRINDEYWQGNDLYKFYLTQLTNSYSQIENEKISANIVEMYAETLYLGRYFRFFTESNKISNSSILRDEFNSDIQYAFSFKFCVDLNQSDTNPLSILLNYTNYKLNLTIYKNTTHNFINQTLYYNDLITESDLEISLIKSDIYTILIDFKNRYCSIAIKDSVNIYTKSYYINDLFQNLNSYNLMLAYNLISKSSQSVFSFTDSIINVNNDSLTFSDLVQRTSDYFIFDREIIIPPNDVPETINRTIGGGLLYLKYNYIYMSYTETKRNSINGLQFSTITSDNEYYYTLFDGNDLNKTINVIFLLNQNGGKMFLRFEFATTTPELITITITTYYTYVVVYTDVQPAENLLESTAMGFLIPLSILMVIVVGFKSNSDSKYLGFLGVYVGLLILYLIEYMNLIFFIISLVFTTVGLYLILKKEKDDSI